MSSFLSAGQNQRQQEGAEQTSPTQQLGAHLADTMRTLSLLTLLALAALCLSDLTDAKPSGPESDKAFMSKQEGNKVVNRLRRYLGASVPSPDPLEPTRELCELDPACDELSNQYGLKTAYRRIYGITI